MSQRLGAGYKELCFLYKEDTRGESNYCLAFKIATLSEQKYGTTSSIWVSGKYVGSRYYMRQAYTLTLKTIFVIWNSNLTGNLVFYLVILSLLLHVTLPLFRFTFLLLLSLESKLKHWKKTLIYPNKCFPLRNHFGNTILIQWYWCYPKHVWNYFNCFAKLPYWLCKKISLINI